MLSLDTEATGLEETDRPFCATAAGENGEVYTEDASVIKELLKEQDCIFFMNAKFDARMLSHWGVDVFQHKVYDIAVMARILRNDHMSYSLDAQAKRMGWAKGTKVEEAIKKGKLYEERRNYFGVPYKVPRYDRVDRATLKEYAMLDARLTYDLGKHYLSVMDANDKSVMEMEAALTPVCYRMERKGLLLNQDYTLQGYHAENNMLLQAREWYRSLTCSDYVNSAKAIQKNITSVTLPTTDAGNPSLTDDVIEALLVNPGISDRDSGILQAVQKIRYFDKRISSYYQSYLNLQDKDNVIHPYMWQAGTRTGRFSYSDPNLQNIPKEEESKEPFLIRGCFKPRRGYVFVSMDYSQMEYRMMADYANEQDVITKVMNGADFHQVTADMFGVSRKYAKTLNFAILYGAGPAKIAKMLGIAVEEARRLVDRYFMALPRVERLVEDIIGTGRGRGYVNNWKGRKLYADKEHCYALPNHLIQGGGADVVKSAMIEIDRYIKGKDISMVLQIHDQLIFEVPRTNDLTEVKVIKEIMENTYPSRNGMKLTVDVSSSELSLAERDFRKVTV